MITPKIAKINQMVNWRIIICIMSGNDLYKELFISFMLSNIFRNLIGLMNLSSLR